MPLALTFEYEQEADGRWIAEIPEVPGALAYGETKEEAAAKAEVIALRTIADQIESTGQSRPLTMSAA